ncbi:SDR family oxidoreductase [Actinomadura kijaniata]|uniref:SDR family oxidoreductase n=1 Tax=Actinomadura kijaniata TaxID=46161 RepID=UPI00082E9989|nr:SDR family oxidoreductase [Actinomadura kijaniata]
MVDERGPGAFADKVALVTGGAGEVGSVLVEDLARAGAEVIVNCFHSYDRGRRLADRLTAEGLRVRAVRASVARPEQVAEMFAGIDRLDLLVNNAATGRFTDHEETTEQALDQAFATNVKGALWCARAARPRMPPGGVVINVSSVGARRAVRDYLPTGVTKAALEALTRYLAVEFAPYGIRVNTVSSGLLDNATGRLFPRAEEFGRAVAEATPMGRLARSRELAGLVLMLASDHASFVTGQTLLADGGLTLTHPAAPAAAAAPNGRAPAARPRPAPPPEDLRSEAIAVVGLGLAVPGARSPEEFWRLLGSGTPQFSDPPPDRWEAADFAPGTGDEPDKTYTQRGGYVDALGPDGEDLSVGWLRHSLGQALEGVATTGGDRFTFSLGYTADGSQHQEEALFRDEVLARATGLATADAELLERLVEDRYGRRGDTAAHLPHRLARTAADGLLPPGTPVHLVDTACSSSLYALDLGMRELVAGEADIAVCGGANVLTPTLQVVFSKNGGLARGGAVRALSAGADGVLFSDGAAVVVLKRLGRALADGDPVHGVIAGTGLSADGRGTSIYKPSADGQRRAISRALADAGLDPAEVSLIVAHATGTPRGDAVELTGLGRCYAAQRTLNVVSNKSLIGHTGWAAGVASVIHLLLAMRHGEIPPQPLASASSARPDLTGTGIQVPAREVAWPPRDAAPRVGAVSGFGFGGTNAHVLIREYRPGAVPAERGSPREEPVIVGYAAVLPEEGRGFGDHYPRPPLSELTLPTATVRRMDRAQLMLLRGVHRLPEDVRALLRSRNERGGAVVGQFGPSRAAMLLRARVHLDELARLLPDGRPALREFASRLRRELAELAPAPTEDSYPGAMPNVASGRLANQFDLHGLAMTVDQGEASLLEAFQVASRHVADGTLEVALVGGVSGNDLPSFQARFPGTAVAEGAFVFAVTSRRIAEHAGLPVLAAVRGARSVTPPAPVRGGVTLAGAEGGPEIVGFLQGSENELRLVRGDEAAGRELVLSRDTPPVDRVARHVLSLAPLEPRRTRGGGPFLVPGSLVLTNCRDDLLRAGPEPDTLIAVDDARAVLHRGGSATPIPLGESMLGGLQPTHLRIVADMDGPALTRLHDAMFLAVRACARRFGEGDSVTVLLCRSAGKPQAGLFTGFVKVLALEFPESDVLAVVHDGDLPQALADAAAETSAQRFLPVVFYRNGRRLAVRARQRSLTAQNLPRNPPLGRDSLVLAAGGGRGIGAELLKALARTAAPRIVVLGTSRTEESLDDPAMGRAAFIRARPAGQSPAEASRAYDRRVRAGEVRDTLAELSALCGEGRVDYHVCDLLDEVAVARVVGHVLTRAPQVDLLLNLAGINRNHDLATKSLEEFRLVREFKPTVHRNLARAFGDARPARWWNAGSYAGFFALEGDSDYAATNDYLFQQAETARDEHTIGFTLWQETGLAATHLQQAHFDQAGQLTAMDNAEGVRHFLRELSAQDPPPATVHLGPREIMAVERTAPGYRAWCHDAFFAGRVEALRSDAITLTRLFDLDRDGYLERHLVRGYPTLPGAFQIAIAGDAARLLFPERVPVAFENLSLDSFLHVHGPDRPHLVRIHGRMTGPDLLHVRVTGDVVAPDGRVLVRDRLHARLDVRLADRPPRPPRWSAWPDAPTTELVNPCVAGAPVIELTGLFAGVRDPRTHPCGRRAELDVDLPEIGRWFPEHTLPVVQLDGLFQLATTQPPGPVDVVVPRAATRVELFDPAPAGPLLLVEDGDVLMSVSADGTVAARVTGLTAASIARLPDPTEGRTSARPAYQQAR